MKDKKVCFVVMPNTYIGIENAIPFIVSLKKNGWNIYAIFKQLADLERLVRAPDYYEILKTNSKIISLNLEPLSRKSIVRIIKTLIPALTKIVFTSRPRIITMGSTDDILLKMIKGISFFKGKYYLLTSLNAPYDYSFYKEYYLDALADPVKRIIIGKNPAIKENPPGKYLGTLLMHSTNDAKRSDLFGLPKERIIIGYPKLRDEWLEYLKDYKIAWNDEILEKEKHVVSILVKNPEVYFFDKTNSCKKFLKEIIVATRKHYKDSLIVIKPKPTKYGKKDVWLGDVLKKINDNRIIVNYIPNPFLARKTLLVFLVGRTSAYFDYVINEIPCIEHINYCEDALKIYKRGSCLPDYGVRRTSTMDELEKAVLEAKKGTFKVMSKAKLRKITAHTDSKDVFNGL